MGVDSPTDSASRVVASSVSECGGDVTKFLVRSEWSPEVLARVVMLLHRLNVEIVALTMRRMRKGKEMRIMMAVGVGHDRSERIEAQLAKVVQVQSVERQSLKGGTRLVQNRPSCGITQIGEAVASRRGVVESQ